MLQTSLLTNRLDSEFKVGADPALEYWSMLFNLVRINGSIYLKNFIAIQMGNGSFSKPPDIFILDWTKNRVYK